MKAKQVKKHTSKKLTVVQQVEIGIMVSANEKKYGKTAFGDMGVCLN